MPIEPQVQKVYLQSVMNFHDYQSLEDRQATLTRIIKMFKL